MLSGGPVSDLLSVFDLHGLIAFSIRQKKGRFN